MFLSLYIYIYISIRLFASLSLLFIQIQQWSCVGVLLSFKKGSFPRMLDCANTCSMLCHYLLQHSLLQSMEFVRKMFPQFHSLCWLLLQHQHWQSLKGGEICSSARIFLEQHLPVRQVCALCLLLPWTPKWLWGRQESIALPHFFHLSFSKSGFKFF